MTQALFFDWFNTLVQYNPPREVLYQKAFLSHGIRLSLSKIYEGIKIADRIFLNGNMNIPTKESLAPERANRFLIYPQSILEKAGINLASALQMEIMREVLRDFKNDYVLFEDVIPVFKKLKERMLKIGIITNADQRAVDLVEKLGLTSYLDVIVTSEQVGVEKPATPIFQAALNQVKTRAEESIYVGDQYDTDILGAINAGMKPVLIDRYNIETNTCDCIKINTLTEVLQHI
jgi:putative hydrolase of the HAD superfamily